MGLNITIKVSGGDTFSLEVEPEMTVLQLKEKCSDKANAPSDKQRLIFKGRIIKDDEVLSALNVEEGNTIHLVRSGLKPAAATTTTTTPPTPNVTTTPPEATTEPQVQFDPNAPFNPDFMSQMFTNNMNNITGLPELNPQNAAALLSSPMVQEMLTQISSNPDLLRTLVETSPFLQPMLQQNPVFGQMLSNPELLRTLMRPGMLQAGLQMHQAMQQHQQQNPGAAGAAGTAPGTATPTPNPNVHPEGAPNFANLLSQMNAMNAMNPNAGANPFNNNFQFQNTDTRPPQERFSAQLQSLMEMGFTDEAANIQALLQTNGDISAAISLLLNR